MSSKDELVTEFWTALKSDRVMMLGLTSAGDDHTRPMTAQVDDANSEIWFFASKESALVKNIRSDSNARATFVSKNYGIFASVGGLVVNDSTPEMIDKHWNSDVAAWYKGKTDPTISLLKFVPKRAEIWRQGSSLIAGIKVLFGADPKEIYKDNAASVKFD